MNKNTYRLVYSKARQMWVAAAESAKSTGNTGRSGERRTRHLPRRGTWYAKWTIIATLVALLGAIPSAHAQIVAAPGSGAQVGQTPNGLPQINIARPSGAGVSLNRYQQFDVQKPGAILNNASGIVTTQQAGVLNGNPNLAGGPGARVIINQVESQSPTQLRGFVEVAGARADVVIANSAGIVVNGGGFINTSRATLTTGQPLLGPDGQLTGFNVSRGLITVEGSGLNASNVDQVDLLARAIKVNAAIFANRLNVVTGANHVDHDTLASTAIAGDGSAPGVSIDVAQLGGMYANRIVLVGTEKGVGMNSAGVIGAQAGDLTLTTEGKLVLTGKTQAGGQMRLSAAQIENSGAVYGQQQVKVSATEALTNTGTLAAAQDLVVSAGHIDSSGVLGSGVQQDGSLVHAGDLHLSSAGVLHASGKQLAGGNAEITGASLDLSGAETSAYGAIRASALAGDIRLTGARTHAQGPIEASATGALLNDQGVLSSQSDVTFVGQRLSNTAGQMWAAHGLTVRTSRELANRGGTLGADGPMQLHAASMVNQQGVVQSGKSLQISTVDLDNRAGRIVSAEGDMSLVATGQLRNEHNDETGKTASDAQGGVIGTRGALAITAGAFANKGTVSAGRYLSVHAATVDNTGGQLASGGSTVLDSAGAIQNSAAGQIAGAQVTLNAEDVDNQGGRIGSLASTVGDVQITARRQLDNSGGSIDATRNLSLASTTLSGAGSLRAARVLTVKVASDLTVAVGQRWDAGDALTVSLPGTLRNQGTLLSGQALHIDAHDINNAGAITAAGLLSTHSSTLTNTGAMVGGSVELAADARLTNTGPQALIGATDARGQLALLAPEIENRDDTSATDTQAKTSIYGAGDVVLAAAKDASGGYGKATRILNQSGLIESGRSMRILAAQMLNTRRVLMTSGFTTQVDPALLARLGISLSGRTGQVDTRDPHAIGGVYVEPPHGGQWNSNYFYTTYTGKAEINQVSAISPKAQLQVGGDLDLSGVDRLENRWSQVSAGGNIKAPGVLDMQSWKGQSAPRLRVTYSGHYHYNNYDNTEHDWTIPFGDAPFIGSRPGGYEQKAPADIREFDLPGYESVFRGNGLLSGTGVSVNNTAGHPSLPSLGLPAGSVSDGHWRADPAIAAASALNVLAHLSLPDGGLFSRTALPTAKYLIETNPAFTSTHAFISSDYYFKQMGWDPSHIEKRLGDGYYEQRLVRDQISSLTGRARLGAYSDLEEQFRALMASGVKLARELQLAPGIGLSADQVAHLTHSVVIMESRTVDGQRVLVPVVYLARTDVELLGNGPVIAARDVDLSGVTSFANSGTVKADRDLHLDAQAIDNRGGRLESGAQMTLASRGDMDLTSTQLKAANLRLDAGRELILDTAVNSVDQHGADGAFRRTTTLGPRTALNVAGDATIKSGGNVSQRAGDVSVGGNLRTDIGGSWTLGTQQTGEKKVVSRANGISDTDVNEAHGSTLHVGGKSTITVKEDFTAHGAQIALDGGGAIHAGGNVTLDAARTTSTINSSSAGGDRTGDYAETLHQSDQTLLGTTLKSGKGLALTSGKDIAVKGSAVSLDAGKLALKAAGDITIGAATETHEFNAHETHTHDGMVSSRREASGIDTTSTLSQGSTMSAGSVSMQSGRNIEVAGSNVVATDDVSLKARGDVHIVTTQDTSRSSTYHDKEESGLLSGGGLTVTVGSRAQSDKAHTASTTNHGSMVGSLKGDTTLEAGNTLDVKGSDLVAGGNLRATAKSISVGIATDQDHQDERHEMRQSGVTIGVQTVGLDALQNAIQQAKGAAGGGDSRVQALRGMAAASGAYDAYKAVPGEVSGLANGKPPEVKLTVSVGGSRSLSTSSEDSTQQRGSHLAAGNTVLLRATGDKSQGQGNVTIVGSDVDAQHVHLEATNRIDLRHSTDTDSTRSENSSSSGSLGVSFGSKGFGVSVAASRAHGDGNSDSAAQTNTHIRGRDSVTLQSGGDTNLIGANVSGQRVRADVGGNLNIASVQDTSESAAHQHSVGGGLSVSQGGASGSFNMQNGSAHGSFAGVKEQAGIEAGKGGFDIRVTGNTDLKGGKLTSEALQNQNHLKSGTLTFSDIQNHSTHDASTFGLSGGMSVGDGGNVMKTHGETSQNAEKSENVGGPSPLYLSDSGSEHAVTKSAVSPAQIEITDKDRQTQDVATLTRETTHLNGTVSKTPDAQAALNGQSELMGAMRDAGEAVARRIGDYADSKREAALKAANKTTDPALKQQYLAEADAWSEGGKSRALMQGAGGSLVGGIAGGGLGAAQGGVGAGLSSLAAGKLNALSQQIADKKPTGNADVDQALGNILANTLATTLGAVTGGSTGALAAHNVDRYNRQLHEDEQQKLAQMKQGRSAAGQQRLEDAACYRVQCAAQMSDANPEKAAALASQQRGEKYLHEQLELESTGQFVRTGVEHANDIADRAGDALLQQAKSVGRGARNAGDQFVGQMQDGARAKMAEPPVKLIAEGIGNGVTAAMGPKGGEPPASSGTALARSTGGAGEVAGQIPGMPGAKLPGHVLAAQGKDGVPDTHQDVENDASSKTNKNEAPLWSSTRSKDAVENAYDHWDKHRSEFPEFDNSRQYVQGARDFVSSPPQGTLIAKRQNGDSVLYNPTTNTFAVKDENGTPKTMFRPDPTQHGYPTNMDYFNAQKR